jgi:hypothetical protein
VAITRTHAVPRGATVLERATIRFADAVMRWAMRRAERRQDRRDAMLAAIHAEQTRKSDPHAAGHMLASMGLNRR